MSRISLPVPIVVVLGVLTGCTSTVAGQSVASDAAQSSVQVHSAQQLNFRKVLDAQTPTTPPVQEAKAARQDPSLVTGTGDSLAESSTATAALTAFTCAAQDPLRGNDDPNLPLLACNQDGSEKYLLGPVFLQGTEIDNAVASPPTQNNPGWTVDLTFKSAGRQTWADFTSKNVSSRAAFVLDTQVLSAPTIQSAIVDGNTQISGTFTQEEAQHLARQIMGG
jgi:preprotein translocase subunit SecD